VSIKEGLEWLSQDDPSVFVVQVPWLLGTVEGDNVTKAAPNGCLYRSDGYGFYTYVELTESKNGRLKSLQCYRCRHPHV